MRGWALAALAAMVTTTTACDRGMAPTGVVFGGGGGAVTLSVTSTTTPTYSWSGGRARLLTVQSSSGEVFWQLEAINLTEGFSSPVQHGGVPTGARTAVTARALQPGVVHTAILVGVDGAQSVRTFTPQPLTTP